MNEESVCLLREIRDAVCRMTELLEAKPTKRSQSAKTRKPILYWREMVAHLDEGFKRKRGSPYPFTPHDFALLKGAARTHQAWGVMALWDSYLGSDVPYYRQTGFKVSVFINDLPKLLDSDWKPRAAGYQRKLETPPAPQAEAASTQAFDLAKTLAKQMSFNR